MREDIIKFIEKYKTAYGLDKEKVEYALTNGGCYWFALSLALVFHGEIFYLPIDGHFICKIDGDYYDIIGWIDKDNTSYRMDCRYDWSEYKEIDPEHARRIERDVIYSI